MERKLATVLFVDLVGSTELVARTDPEVVRRRVTRFFDQVSHCVTTHGGIVEKFAGDAVMAAFGIPQAHEDDAERGIRAALAVLDSVRALGLEARLGVEAGEVVTDERDSTFATGEAVNLAARLQQAAAPGEILVGPVAHRLTVGRFEFEQHEPLQLKGFADLVPVWRPLAAAPDTGRALSVGAPFIGREKERELLENTFERAVRHRRAHLFTIFGEPGVGKSRLAREFLEGVEGATILVGRCLPYGEGVTYWPLAEMVKVAAGIADDDPIQDAVGKLRACCGDDAVADLLGLAAGVLELVQGERSQQEIAWATREWVAELADAQPLILVFEDIHWAEEPLLELVEHLAERVRDAPLLILCLARPELLDVRPGWGGGRLRATAIELEALAREESEQLVDALLAEEQLPLDVRGSVLAKSEGNPLFVEETVRMLVERGDGAGRDRIPDTLQALIAARIDRLPGAAKTLLRRASVFGRIFWPGALAALTPELAGEVEDVLDDLVLRDFVLRESRSSINGEQAFRFKHVLIRDVAYAGLSKSARAELHERAADWILERAGDELIEIRAYHLDQAAALHEELDGEAPELLAVEAALALEGAGRRALAREANRSARRLLRRAVELAPTLERRYLAARAAWKLSDLPAVSAEMQVVRELAQAEGDACLEGRALVALAEVALLRDADLPRGRELVERALELLGDRDSEDRYEALAIRAHIGWWLGNLDDDECDMREARRVAQALGRKDLEAGAVEELGSVRLSRLHLDAADELLREALELAEESGNITAKAWALFSLGRVAFARRQLDVAEPLLHQAAELFVEAGLAWGQARTLNWLAWVMWRRGDLRAAERTLRDSIRILARLEDRGTLCESQRCLAQVLVELGRIEEAEEVALDACRTVGPHDMASRATTQMALGIVRAAQGRDSEAEALLREALAIVEPTQMEIVRVEVLGALVGFLRGRGRADEAERYAAERRELLSGTTVAERSS